MKKNTKKSIKEGNSDIDNVKKTSIQRREAIKRIALLAIGSISTPLIISSCTKDEEINPYSSYSSYNSYNDYNSYNSYNDYNSYNSYGEYADGYSEYTDSYSEYSDLYSSYSAYGDSYYDYPDYHYNYYIISW